MINAFRFAATILTVFVCTTGTGCAEVKHSSYPQSFNTYIDNLNQADKNLSNWNYQSQFTCAPEITETETKIDNFQIPPITDIWSRIRNGFQLEQSDNTRIQQELNWYSKHPSYMARVSKRGAKYLFYIVEELEKRKMPMELALLPIVESAFDPFAYSHGQASGMWQIIPGTGKMLGLKQNWWYDGRRDIIESTDAALDYLQKLHKQFDGDWILALASYNSGAGNVRKAISRNKQKGRSIDYWSLDLPKETEAYVPKLLAIKALVLQPDAYQISLHPTRNQPYFKQVDIGSQIDVAHAAELAGISMDMFYVLNPGYNRWATDPKGPHRLLIPAQKSASFETKLAAVPKDQRVTWDRYKIQPGDTLSTIAQKFKTTGNALQSVNDIKGTNIRAGQTLLVPVASAAATHYAYSLPQRIKKKQATGNGHKLDYIVRQGDSLWTISRRHNTSSTKLAYWNGMAPSDPIHPGQKLVIWSKTKSSSKENSGVVRKLSYKVRKGDSLAGIAGKFSVKVAEILQWNQVNPKKYLQPGDSLTIFVDVKRMN